MEQNSINVTQVKSFWYEYKWLVFLQLGIVLSFILTQIFFNDFSDGSRLFTFVWFGFALIIDFIKGQSGGICLEAISQIKEFKENNISKFMVISLSCIIYICTLNISYNASVAAQLLFNQDKRVENFKNSDISKKIDKLSSERSKKQESLNKITDALNKAIEKDSNISNEQIKQLNDIDKSIKLQNEKIDNLNNRISIAIRNKKKHSTLDGRKEEAQKEIKRLQENRDKITLNVTSGQDEITKNSNKLRFDIKDIDKKIKKLQNGDSVESKTEKKTGIQLLKGSDEAVKEYMKFIAGVIEFAIVFCSFMYQRQRRLSKKGNDIVVDDKPKINLNKTVLSTNETWEPGQKNILHTVFDIFKNKLQKEIKQHPEQKNNIAGPDPLHKKDKKINLEVVNTLEDMDGIDFKDAKTYLMIMFDNQKIKGQSPSVADMTNLLKGKITPKQGQKHSEYVRTIRGMLTRKGVLESISGKCPKDNKTLILKSREELGV